MNSPKDQAELYRKAAETIEMCAKHGIKALFKVNSAICNLVGHEFRREFHLYEWPIAVIEGHLVWADTVVYNQHWINGVPAHACSFTPNNDASWSLNPPKQPLCVVEGKPVFKGDKLYCKDGTYIVINDIKNDALIADCSNGLRNSEYTFGFVSWNPPKRTVMVEMLVEDAEYFTTTSVLSNMTQRMNAACRKALEELKS